jgi:hypothetical protein
MCQFVWGVPAKVPTVNDPSPTSKIISFGTFHGERHQVKRCSLKVDNMVRMGGNCSGCKGHRGVRMRSASVSTKSADERKVRSLSALPGWKVDGHRLRQVRLLRVRECSLAALTESLWSHTA